MCLAQGSQRSDAGEARTPAATRSRVKHSTTEPLRSLSSRRWKSGKIFQRGKESINSVDSKVYNSYSTLLLYTLTLLTHKVPPIICSRGKFKILLLFQKLQNKAWYFMGILCWQTILRKYNILFFLKIRKDVAKLVVCCSHDCILRFNIYLI